MPMVKWMTILLLTGLVAVGCKKRVEPAPPPPEPTRPARMETHVVRLERVQFSEFDFSLTSTGQPMQVRIAITEDGREIEPTGGMQTITGMRGERDLDPPIEWLVKFDPTKNYQIVLTEQPPAGETGKRIFIPATPKQGLWPIGENNGHVTFGSESYLEFKDTVAE